MRYIFAGKARYVLASTDKYKIMSADNTTESYSFCKIEIPVAYAIHTDKK